MGIENGTTYGDKSKTGLAAVCGTTFGPDCLKVEADYFKENYHEVLDRLESSGRPIVITKYNDNDTNHHYSSNRVEGVLIPALTFKRLAMDCQLD